MAEAGRISCENKVHWDYREILVKMKKKKKSWFGGTWLNLSIWEAETDSQFLDLLGLHRNIVFGGEISQRRILSGRGHVHWRVLFHLKLSEKHSTIIIIMKDF